MTRLPEVSPKGKELAQQALELLTKHQRITDSIYTLEAKIAKGSIDLSELKLEFSELLERSARGESTLNQRYLKEAQIYAQAALLDTLTGAKGYLELDRERAVNGYKILLEGEIKQGEDCLALTRWLTQRSLEGVGLSNKALEALLDDQTTLTTK